MLYLQDIYDMTQEDNIFSAKRILVDSVYSQANLEGIAVTYAQTVDILNNVNVDKVTPKDISKVCCLRDTWKYVLDNIDAPLDLGYLETIHELVARFDVDYRYLGKLRMDEVLIGGTRWRPDIPDPEQIHNKLMEAQQNRNVTDRAIRTGLWIMRAQPFMDGNKRVGSFVINKILIENGKGLFNVPVELDGAFKERLVSYYESGDPENMILWIAQNCMDGTHKISEPVMKETDNEIVRHHKIQESARKPRI